VSAVEVRGSPSSIVSAASDPLVIETGRAVDASWLPPPRTIGTSGTAVGARRRVVQRRGKRARVRRRGASAVPEGLAYYVASLARAGGATTLAATSATTTEVAASQVPSRTLTTTSEVARTLPPRVKTTRQSSCWSSSVSTVYSGAGIWIPEGQTRTNTRNGA